MLLKYVAYTSAGERVTGSVRGDAVSAAEAILWEKGLTVVSLKKVIRRPSIQELLPTLFKLKSREMVSFCRQMVTLLDSGLPLLSAITILQGQVRHHLLKQSLEKVHQDIEGGNSFSQSLEKHPTVFSSFLVRMVRVGEETGKLQPMLIRVADYMEKQGVLVARVKKSLTYPAIMVGVGSISVYLLLTFSLPALAGLLKEYGGQLPLTTRLLLGTSNFLTQNAGKLFMLFLLLAGLGYWFLGRPVNRYRRTRLLMRLPLIGKVILDESMSRFSYTLAFLLGSGLSFTESLDMLVITTDNPIIAAACQQLRNGILSGQKFSHVLSLQPVFPSLVVQMAAVGEETGRLDTNLSLLGKFYEEETDRRLSGLTSLIEPAVTIGMGLGVGFIAISVMGSLYGVMGQIK